MHKVTILAVAFLAVVACAFAYEGQDIYAEPNCAIVSDHEKKFRDISDPTHYWTCPEGQEKAESWRCADDHAFMEAEQTCVLWADWKWVEPYTK